MATPAQTVQFRDPEDLLAFYINEGIPAFAIKQRGTLNFKFEGDSVDEGREKLIQIVHMLVKSKTAAIYALCQYNNFGDEITDKTPASLSNNFRFNEFGEGMGFPGATGPNADIIQELKSMRAEIKALQEERDGDGHKLGVIGEIMELDAVQPIVLAIAGVIADKIAALGGGVTTAGAKTGELKRVSGIPGIRSSWKEDLEVIRSLDTLSEKLEDFGEVMAKLARIALNSPVKFNMFVAGLRRMKD